MSRLLACRLFNLVAVQRENPHADTRGPAGFAAARGRGAWHAICPSELRRMRSPSVSTTHDPPSQGDTMQLKLLPALIAVGLAAAAAQAQVTDQMIKSEATAKGNVLTWG